MASRRMKISALVIILALAFEVGCTSFAASDRPTLAAQRADLQGDCAGARLVFGEVQCGETDLSCSFALVPRSPASNMLMSSRSDRFAKGGQLWSTAGFPSRLSEEAFFQKREIVSTPQIIAGKKVPIHLINSVLTI